MQQALTPIPALPAVNAAWPDASVDGTFCGVITAPDGTTHALVLLNVKPSRRLNWADAMAWAKEQGGDLPTTAESAMLFANSREAFEPYWHWTSTQSSASYAYYQDFDYGTQYNFSGSYEGRARAVRRFAVQSFIPSVATAAVAEAA